MLSLYAYQIYFKYLNFIILSEIIKEIYILKVQS